MRTILRLFYIFPIKKNTVLLTSFGGRQYSCNPKYICEYLKSNKQIKVIYAIEKDKVSLIPAEVETVIYKSIKHIFYLMTCEVIIVNSSDFSKYLPFRKKQCYLNTWHGSFIFKIGDRTNLGNIYGRKILGLCEENLTYYLRNCSLDVGPLFLRNDKGKKKYLDIGYPRNDLFFCSRPQIIRNIKDKLGIDYDKRVVLYAPTYRDSYNKDTAKSMAEYGFELLDIDKVTSALRQKFNCDHVVLFRAHHDMIGDSISESTINVSNYPDMQELLLIADYLITDYSSSMVDFCLQGKPGFLYTPDIESFAPNIPSFNPPDLWPYKYAKTNEDFCDLIREYDVKSSKDKIDAFLSRINAMDDGTASKRLLDYLFLNVGKA